MAARAAAAQAPDALPYFENRGWLTGFWTRPWAQHDYRVGFDAIAEAGVRYVALTGAKTRTRRVIGVETTLEEAAEVGREARQRGLTITTVYGGDIPLAKGPEPLRKMIESCEAAGGWSVLLSSVGNESTYELSCRTVAECADYAREKKIAIVLKPHGGTTGTGPQLRDALQRIGRTNVTLMYDPGNIFFYSGGKIDPVSDCESVLGLVTGLSVKDFRAPREVMFTPGTGQVNFPALMKRLVEGGFKHGLLVIEALTPGDLKQTLAEARQAKEFVEQKLRSS
jgi:sugar phosphate isomerase/epimerase